MLRPGAVPAPAAMPLTDTLCTQCGLCCDGSLFADVELRGRAELVRIELLGGEIDSTGGEGDVLALPCAALRGTRCGIYAHRPRTCRTFECRLLKNAGRGTVSVPRALRTIATARRRIRGIEALLAKLGARDRTLPLRERCAEALADAPSGRAGARALGTAFAALDRLLRASFLR